MAGTRSGARLPRLARVALGLIRLANGSVALAAPEAFARRLGVDPAASPAAPYVLRLFGVRTVLLGYELLGRDEAARARALRLAPLVHASDLVAAGLAGAGGALPPRAARVAAAVSAGNLALALTARAAARER